jgi:hypothetical protein
MNFGLTQKSATHEAGLVVEVDGCMHFITEEAVEYDKKRDKFLRDLGLDVFRITSVELRSNPEGIIFEIFRKTRQKVLKEEHSKQWRYASGLQKGDLIYMGIGSLGIPVKNLLFEDVHEEVFDLQVEDVDSYLTSLCAVKNPGLF